MLTRVGSIQRSGFFEDLKVHTKDGIILQKLIGVSIVSNTTLYMLGQQLFDGGDSIHQYHANNICSLSSPIFEIATSNVICPVGLILI